MPMTPACQPAEAQKTIAVFLLDDHEVVRRGVRDLLEAEPDIRVAGEAGTAAAALARIEALRPDVAVLDVRLPDGDGRPNRHRGRFVAPAGVRSNAGCRTGRVAYNAGPRTPWPRAGGVVTPGGSSVLARSALLLALFCLGAAPACADSKPRIEKAADLPRFTYKIDGKVDALVTDPAKFDKFAAEVRRDTESVLDKYEIADHATLRQLEGELAQLDFLAGNYDAALARAARIRELQDKPADKLMSGMQLRAMIAAQKSTGNTTSDAYRADVGKRIDADLAAMPYEVVQNEVKEAKAGAEIASEALMLGYVRNVIQSTVDKAGAISSDLAPVIVNARYRIVATLPLKSTLVST